MQKFILTINYLSLYFFNCYKYDTISFSPFEEGKHIKGREDGQLKH
jgi:hypothetical protein